MGFVAEIVFTGVWFGGYQAKIVVAKKIAVILLRYI